MGGLSHDSGNVVSLQLLVIKTQSPQTLLRPVQRKVCWGGVHLRIELDKCSSVGGISRVVYDQHRCTMPKIQTTRLTLTCYAGKLPDLSKATRCASYNGRTVESSLFVVDCSGPSLCEANFNLKVNQLGTPVCRVIAENLRRAEDDNLRSLLNGVAEWFLPGFGRITKPRVPF